MYALIFAPVFLLGPQIITPDAPLFFGWSLCILAAIGFQKRRFHSNILGDPTPPLFALSLLSGFALAFCAYSKYSALLAAVLLIMSGCGLWNALMIGVISLSLVSPYLLWHIQQGQIEGAGISFQLANGLGDTFKPNNFKFMGDLWAAQLFLWTPFVFISTFVFLFADIRRFFLLVKSSRLSGTLFLWAMVPLLFFSLTALKRPAEANWPLLGFLAAIVMIIARLRQRPFTLWMLIIQNIFIVALSWMVLTQGSQIAEVIQPINPKWAEKLNKPSRLREFSGWDRLHTLLEDTTQLNDDPILIESYQLFSSLLFIDSSKSKEHTLEPRMFFYEEISRPSEFNRQAQYLLDPELKKKEHWRLLRSSRKMKGCRLYQGLLKEASEVYFLYKCKGS